MNAQTIIERACSEGLIVTLADSGNIKARGDHEVVIRWQPLLKQHKEEIVNLLSGEPGGVIEATRPTLPQWCRDDCPGLEIFPLPNEGGVAGCVNPDTESWRRLDWMRECPAMTRKPAAPPVSGLPCGGCGSTSYRRLVNGYEFPNGSRADGWHCGGEHCEVKLLTGKNGT